MNRKKFLTAALGAGALGAQALKAAAACAPVAPAAPEPTTAPAANLSDLLSLDDVESLARKVMQPSAYAYVAGGAADEVTLRWNREKYRDIRLQPQALRELTSLDCSTTLLGRKMNTPILLAPTGVQALSHFEAELATARGAGAFGATMVLSSGSNKSIEEVMAVATHPVWFQLYLLNDRGLSKALVERVQSAGAQALCVTVDAALDGPRNRQYRTPYTLPPGVGFPHYAGLRNSYVTQTLDTVRPANLLWRDIEWLRSFVKIPMLLKGVINPADAETGIQAGADGIIVSNHGGRCLDTLPATIEALPRVVEQVAGRVPVIVDGGIRRGTDIVKALALGAAAVQIGRPYVYGLASGGADGVAHVLKILRQELLMAMALLGRPTLASIDRSVLWL